MKKIIRAPKNLLNVKHAVPNAEKDSNSAPIAGIASFAVLLVEQIIKKMQLCAASAGNRYQ